jgi:hypothetical protein
LAGSLSQLALVFIVIFPLIVSHRFIATVKAKNGAGWAFVCLVVVHNQTPINCRHGIFRNTIQNVLPIDSSGVHDIDVGDFAVFISPHQGGLALVASRCLLADVMMFTRIFPWHTFSAAKATCNGVIATFVLQVILKVGVDHKDTTPTIEAPHHSFRTHIGLVKLYRNRKHPFQWPVGYYMKGI